MPSVSKTRRTSTSKKPSTVASGLAAAINGAAGASGPTRTEKDTMGEMAVPASVLYGASTQRAVLNFPVSGRPLPFAIIAAYATLKAACASVNQKLGRLDKGRAEAIRVACAEIGAGLAAHGGWAKHFPVDVFQTGSGTSTNMNANEVIANLICLARGTAIGSSKDQAYLKAGGVHPNDHVNMGQSSNDTFPTAIHVAAALSIATRTIPALRAMHKQLDQQARAWDRIVKIGRTHLADATPIRLGQEFSGYASQVAHSIERCQRAVQALCELPIGGTAVGTGINAHEKFDKLVCAELSRATGLKFRACDNHFEAQHAKDACVEAAGHLKTVAVSLSKIANDIRWMGSGPRCGIGELVLPAVQPGSSIMPGKVNPVIAESLIMVCCQVIANDAAVTYGGFGGVGSLLDLNVAMPLIAERLLESSELLASASAMFTQNLLAGLRPDEQRCSALIEGSLAMCTSLVPVIGYDKSAALAKEAFKEGKTVRQIAEKTLVGTPDLAGEKITRETLSEALDPWSMTLPGGEGSAGG
jgi:fumarate hydratase class II